MEIIEETENGVFIGKNEFEGSKGEQIKTAVIGKRVNKEVELKDGSKRWIPYPKKIDLNEQQLKDLKRLIMKL